MSSTKRNLTVSLDAETINRAKVIAARKGTSVSKLVTQIVNDVVDEDRRYEAAMRKAYQYLAEGFPFGGHGIANRDELHER